MRLKAVFGFVALLALSLNANSTQTTASDVTIFGPKTYKPALLKPATYSATFQKKTNPEPYKLVIQNGSGKAFSFKDCSKLSIFKKIVCLAENVVTTALVSIDRVADGSIKINGTKVATISLSTTTVVIPISNLTASNTLSLSLRGLPTASLKVEIRAPATSANLPPIASFTTTPSETAVVPASVAFNAMASSDPDASDSIASYQWSFGDGSVGSGLLVNHVYSSVGTYSIKLTVTDTHGASSSVSKTLSVKQNVLPIAKASATPLTGDVPLNVSFTAQGSSDSDGTIASYSWNFGDGAMGSGRDASHTYTSAGTFTAVVTVTDDKGATATASVSIQAMTPNVKPTAVLTASKTQGPAPFMVAFDARGSSDSDGTIAKYVWDFGDGTQTETQTPTAAHEFKTGSSSVVLTVVDNRGGEAVASVSITATEIQLPPDPKTIAPILSQTSPTLPYEMTKFLYSGPNAIQTGVADGTIDKRFVSVIKGQVVDEDGSPVSGVTVKILNHSEYGSTLTRADGAFDLAVNGGASLIVSFERAGYYQAQRYAIPPHQGFIALDKVYMLRPDPVVTEIAISSPTAQLAHGSTSTDKDGVRTATILFPANTGAQLRMPNGSLKSVPSLHVRAKEYTVGDAGPKRMPAYLPATSAYTYAVQLTADEVEAFGAKGIQFSKPVSVYVDNFIGFDVGDEVPVGIYNMEKGRWEPSKNARVIKVLGIANSKAQLDVTGSGTVASASDLTALGIDTEELQKIAQTFSSGQSFWRYQLDHFSITDANAYQTDIRNINIPAEEAKSPATMDDPCAPQGHGSVIDISKRSLGEVLPIQGTPYSLVYSSQRMPGQVSVRALDIPITGSDLSSLPDLAGIDLKVTVAGQVFEKSYPPLANQLEHYVWDGRDAYGREILSAQPAQIEITYRVTANYLIASRANSVDETFAYLGPGLRVTAIQSRQETVFTRTYEADLGSSQAFAQQGVGGWTMNVHHSYDPITRTLYTGDGKKILSSDIGRVFKSVAGTGVAGFSGDGGAATKAQLGSSGAMAVDADNSIYIRDGENYRIRKVDSNGIITTIAGTGVEGFSGDGGPATSANIMISGGLALGDDADGALYFCEAQGNRIRKIDKNGIITTIAGTGVAGFSGDGGLATLATLNLPADLVVKQGSIYFNDSGNNRIRVIRPDGTIQTVAGTGTAGFSGDDGPAVEAQLHQPLGLSAGPNGDLYLTDSINFRVRRIDRGGIIRTVAGGGNQVADGLPATDAALIFPAQVVLTPDNSMYIANVVAVPIIQRVDPRGFISLFAGTTSVQGPPVRDGEFISRARLAEHYGIAAGPDGTIYVSQGGLILKVTSPYSGVGDSDILIPSQDGNELFEFDSLGRHLRTLNSKTGATKYTFNYSSEGRLISITDGDQNVTSIERDGSGQASTITAPFGQVTKLGYGSDGYLASVANDANETHRMSYSSGGLLLSFQKPKGNYSTFTYDEAGQLVSDLDQLGGGTYLDRVLATAGYTTSVRTAGGITSSYSIQKTVGDGVGTITTNADGTVSQRSDDKKGLVYLDEPSAVARYTLSADPRMGATQSYPARVVETSKKTGKTSITQTSRVATVDPENAFNFTQTDTTDFNGAQSVRQFSSSTRTLVETSAEGRAVTTQYDSQLRPLKVSPDGLTPSERQYDAQGRIVKVTQGDRVTSYSYDSRGKRSQTTDPMGRVTSYLYDSADRLVSEIRPDSSVVSYSYDANGNQIGVTPPTRPLHAFDFSVVDLLTQYTPPGSTGPTKYAYTLDRNIASINQPDGSYANFAYDSTTGKEIAQATSEGSSTKSYGSDGQVSSSVSPDNIRTDFTWDGERLLTEMTYGQATGQVALTYDVNKNPATLTVNGNSASLGYDADNLVTVAGPLVYSYVGKTNLIQSVSAGNLTTTLIYNGFGEVLSEQTSVNGSPIASFVYERDKLGRVTRKTESGPGGTAVKDYLYHQSGALTQVKVGGIIQATYGYDQNGNRILLTQGSNTINGTYDQQDRIQSYGAKSYTQNAKGDLVKISSPTGDSEFSYDVSGQLKRASLSTGHVVTYLYDSNGRRRVKLVDGVRSEIYVYQDQLKIAAILDASGALKQRYIYGSRDNVPDAAIISGQVYRFVTDQVGSVRYVINTGDGSIAQALDYDEFGRVVSDTNPGFQPFGFAGGLYDRDTKLVHFGARDYDPETGRWFTKDPIRFVGDISNIYRYLENDPVNNIDPSGLYALDTRPLGGGGGAAPIVPIVPVACAILATQVKVPASTTSRPKPVDDICRVTEAAETKLCSKIFGRGEGEKLQNCSARAAYRRTQCNMGIPIENRLQPFPSGYPLN
jgi:RHS repeat-associated protein